jgi:hypothetical protein
LRFSVIRGASPLGLSYTLFRTLVVAALCLFAAPRAASAEWHITPMIGVTFAGRTTLIDLQGGAEKKHLNVGGAVTLLGAGIIGAEGIGVFTPGFFEAERSRLGTDTPPPAIESSMVIAVMGNAVLTVPRRWTEYFLRPYVSGGFGVLRATQTQAVEALPVHATMAAYNIGGGAVGFLSQRTGIRFDLRYYSTLRDTDQGTAAIGLAHLHYMSASVGVVIRR